MPIDAGKHGPVRNNDPADDAQPLTKSDSLDLLGATYNATASPTARGVYVGGAGDLVVTTAAERKVTFAGAIAGTVIPIRIKRLWSTGTTATLVLGLL